MDERRHPDISVVIPTLNGYETLALLIPRLCALRENAGESLGEMEILVVDDGSTELLPVDLEKLSRRRSSVSVLHLSRCTGQVHATLVGVAAARGAIVITMDDDGSHPPEIVPRMVRILRQDDRTDLVYAAPASHLHPPGNGRPPVRRFGTVLNNLLFRRFLGLPHRIPVGSFRAIRAGLLQRALETPVRYPYLSAMLLQFRPGVAVVRYRSPLIRTPSRHTIRRLVGVWGRLVLYWGPLRPLGALMRPRRPFVADRGCL